MKKTLFLILTSVCLINTVYAQQYEYEDRAPARKSHHRSSHEDAGIDIDAIRIGVFFAPAMGWMHPTASRSDDRHYLVNSEGNKLGYSWGPMIEYYFAENYGISTGFMLNSVGGKISTTLNAAQVTPGPSTVLATDFSYNLQFLEVPFALKLRSDPIGNSDVRIFGQLGLTLGVNIGKKATYEVQYNNAAGVQKEVDGDNEKLSGALAIAPVMLQMNIGAGIEYPITEKMFFYTGLFFNNGFLPDATNPKNYTLGYSGTFTDGNIRLNSLGLRVGIFF